MNKKIISFVLLLMMVTAEIAAQKQEVRSVQWQIASDLPAMSGQKQSLGFAGPVTGIHHDVLIVAGGANFPDSMPWLGGKKKYYDDGSVFKISKEGKVVYYKSIKLPFSLAYSANCSTSQGLVVAGGENENGVSNKVLLIQWNNAKANIIIRHLPDLPLAVTNAAITTFNNKVYVAGGETKDSVSNLFLVLDIRNTASGWKQLPSLPKPVSHTVMVAQSNGSTKCIYLLGGRKKNAGSTSDLYSSVFQFDFKTNQWAERNPLPYALSAGTGVAVGSNDILLFGGDRGETFHKTEELIVAISDETDSVRKQILNQQKIQLQSMHPGFDRNVLLYNTVKDDWTIIASIPFPVPATTTAIKWGMNVIIPSGEIKAGVRTPQILLGKFSFRKEPSSKK